MTRAELRRLQKEAKKSQKVFTLTQADIDKIKDDATREAVFHALSILFPISVYVMRKEFGWGTKRLTRFSEALTDYYFEYDKSDISPQEYRKMVLEETGVSFEVLPEVV